MSQTTHQLTKTLTNLPKLTHTKPILFFDGECVLCNAGVRFILERDHPNQSQYNLAFCRVQSETGRQLLSQHGLTQQQVMDRFVLLDTNQKVYTASSAALRVALRLPFPYPLLYGFVIVPKFVRDWMYDVVAQNRYKWGKHDKCMMYRKEIMERFVDHEEVDKK